MINEVYQMCLALLNKNNYGYMTPMEFNLFAEQAQLDIFEDLFYDYNMQIHKSAGRRSNTGYPDIAKGIEETISIFSNTVGLVNAYVQPMVGNWSEAFPVTGSLNINNLYNLPEDYYLINKLFYCPTLLYDIPATQVTGLAVDGFPGGNQVQGNFPFNTDGIIKVGDYVVNTLPEGDPRSYYPLSTVMSWSNNQLYASDNFIWRNGVVFPSFKVFSKNKITEIEKVSQKKIFNLTNSNLTAPTPQYPAYVLRGSTLTTSAGATPNAPQQAEIYPIDTINKEGMVLCQYIRYPRTPLWTYNTVGTRAVFNQNALDYQDFELPQDNFQDLVARILQYGGLTIREVQAVQYGQSMETGEASEEMQK